ncbi:MAG: amidohydrolase [Deltaproteobacteria bacterium]
MNTLLSLLLPALAALALLLGPTASHAAPAGLPRKAAVPSPADVVFLNGKIVTLDTKGSVVSAVAIRNGRFVAVGTDSAVRKLAGKGTRIVDLDGKTVVPGLIDAHCHPAPTMVFTQAVDARAPGVPTVAKVLLNIEERVKVTPKGDWVVVVGSSASQTKFLEKRLPSRAELDRAAPENPVWFWNGTHAEVLNSKGLAALGISKGNLKLPHGGRVEVDANGEPTGQMFEGEANVPFVPDAKTVVGWFAKDIPALWNARGFTTVNGMLALDEAAALRAVARSGTRPTIRYSHFVFAEPNGVGMPADLSVLAMPAGTSTDDFKTTGIKLWIDGEVDAGSGFCKDPYADPTGVPDGGRGLLVTTEAQATDFARRARAAGLGVALHASCDASSEIAVRALRTVAREGGKPTLQRMDHYGQFVGPTPEVSKAVKELGIHVVTQPAWLLFLGKSTLDLLGEERTATAWRYRSMVKAGLKPAGSSDTTGAYLEASNPFVHMKAAVTRRSDMGIVQPEEALSVADALRMWTLWGARAIGEERSRGSIEKGKLADMTVLTEDLFTIPPERIDQVRAAQTIVGGEVVYRADPG